jgi:uncharacterized membrane protein
MTTVVVAVSLVALVAIAAAAMVGLEWTDSPNTETLILILVGLAGTTVATQIVSLARTQRSSRTLDRINEAINGDLDQRIAAIVRREVPLVVRPIVEEVVEAALRHERRDKP